METKYQHANNGQEVRQEDIANMSGNAAMADDRVLWELFRLLPYDVAGPQKVIIPSGVDGWVKQGADNSTAMVHPETGGGRVRVRAFRAAISSIDTSDNLERVRGIRSGYYAPTSAGFTSYTISVNAAADPRWTLLYAKIEPDKDGDTADVKKRDKTSGIVSTVAGVVINKKTTVSLGTVDGTAAASPTRPALPADAAGAYYIPLAYILVPSGFTALTVLERERIHEAAPCIAQNSATGVVSMRPANQQWAIDGTVDTNQSGAAATPIFRPGAYLPPAMVGGEQRLILIQNHLAPLSHTDGDVVDDSCDWRFRYFQWAVCAKTGNTTAAAFASDRQGTGTGLLPSAWTIGSAANGGLGSILLFGMGQSFVNDSSGGGVFSVADGHGAAVVLRSVSLTVLGGTILIYVRDTDGALILRKTGTNDAQLFIWLTATAPYSNYGTV